MSPGAMRVWNKASAAKDGRVFVELIKGVFLLWARLHLRQTEAGFD
jgi:hypothetical protein